MRKLFSEGDNLAIKDYVVPVGSNGEKIYIDSLHVLEDEFIGKNNLLCNCFGCKAENEDVSFDATWRIPVYVLLEKNKDFQSGHCIEFYDDIDMDFLSKLDFFVEDYEIGNFWLNHIEGNIMGYGSRDFITVELYVPVSFLDKENVLKNKLITLFINGKNGLEIESYRLPEITVPLADIKGYDAAQFNDYIQTAVSKEIENRFPKLFSSLFLNPEWCVEKLEDTCINSIDYNVLRYIHDGRINYDAEVGTVFYGNEMFKLTASKVKDGLSVNYTRYSPLGDFACAPAEEMSFDFKLKSDELDRNFYIKSNGSGSFLLDTPHLWEISYVLCEELEKKDFINYDNLPVYKCMKTNKSGFFQQLDRAIKEYPIMQLAKKSILSQDEARSMALFYDKMVYHSYDLGAKEIVSQMIKDGFTKSNIIKIGANMESIYEGFKPDWVKEILNDPGIKKMIRIKKNSSLSK